MISLVPLGDDREDATAARLDLLYVALDLVVGRIPRGEHDHRHVLVDERDRPVLHLRRRVTLGVDVGDLLELERALQGDGEVVAAPEVEEIVVLGVELGDLRGSRSSWARILPDLGRAPGSGRG